MTSNRFWELSHILTKLELIYAFCSYRPERLKLIPAEPTPEQVEDMFQRCCTAMGQSSLYFVETPNGVEDCHPFTPNSFPASSKDEAENLVYLQRHH